METATTVPEEVKQLNWGALFLSWIWSIGNQVWIGLIGIIPCFTPFVAIYLLIKGNEMAWNGPRQWESVEQFKAVQAAWLKWGLIVLAVNIVGMFFWGAAFIAAITAAISNGGASH